MPTAHFSYAATMIPYSSISVQIRLRLSQFYNLKSENEILRGKLMRITLHDQNYSAIIVVADERRGYDVGIKSANN